MPEARGLRGLQRTMLEGILGMAEPAPERLRRLLRDPPRGDADERWHIYATGLQARGREAVENDYPALAKVLGPGALASLVARYLKRHPPISFDIGRLGASLASFLESDPLREELPFLADLARLEWALAEAFVATDEDPWRWQDLAGLGPEQVAELPLRLRAGTARIHSDWPVHAVWSCRYRPLDEIDIPMERGRHAVLVTRNDLDMVCRSLDRAEEAVLDVARRSGRLGDAVAEGAQPRELVGAFRRLVENGAFVPSADGSPSRHAKLAARRRV